MFVTLNLLKQYNIIVYCKLKIVYPTILLFVSLSDDLWFYKANFCVQEESSGSNSFIIKVDVT